MQTQEPVSDSLTLYYPEIRGSIQPVRNLLFYLDARWTELSSRNSSEVEGEFNNGFPKLIHNDIQLTDITAIFRHLARSYGRQDLLGLTPQSKATINQFMFKFPEIRKKLMRVILETAVNVHSKKGRPEEVKLNALKSFLQNDCPIVKNMLLLHMKNRSWVMGYLTMVDFFFYEICFYLSNFLGTPIKNHAIYRNILVFKKLFEAQEFFVEHQAEIEGRKIFPPFRSVETFRAMQKIWQGKKEVMA